jgi:hypothetical protein
MPFSRELFLPPEPRSFSGRRTVRAALRALHTLAGGLLIGAHVFAAPADAQLLWLVLMLASGIALFATDLHASGAILFELRGLLVLVKIALTASVAIFPAAAGWLLAVVLVIGSVGSHLPGRLRHWLGWRVAGVEVDRRTG